jgi:hypothetical protein
MPYEPTVEFRGLVWTHDPEGEYGQYDTEYKGHKLQVSTTRDGDDWDYTVDDGEMRSADINSIKGAMKTAMDDVDGM